MPLSAALPGCIPTAALSGIGGRCREEASLQPRRNAADLMLADPAPRNSLSDRIVTERSEYRLSILRPGWRSFEGRAGRESSDSGLPVPRCARIENARGSAQVTAIRTLLPASHATMLKFYYKSTCSTCRKAKTLLQELGIAADERDMSKQPLTADELRALIGDREIKPFLNTRTEMYRERSMKTNPPSKDEAIALMAENANLVRRPLLVSDDAIVFGFDEEAYRQLTS